MRKLYFFSLFFIFSSFLFGQDIDKVKEKYSQIQNEIDYIQKKYVPDKRGNVFDIKITESRGNPVLKGFTTVTDVYNDLVKLAKQYDAIDSVKMLPTEDLNGKIYGVINLSVADIRVKNDYSAEMATQAILGTPIHVLQKDGWFRIQTPDGYIGWTERATFQAMNKSEFESWKSAEKVIFTDYFGFSYLHPDKNSQTVSDLVNGNILKLEGEEGEFFKVSYPDRRIAYILKQQSKPYDAWISSIQLSGESFVKKAFTLMGIPYVWGGTSVKGMDCSGFTKTVLFMHGVILMRDASQQAYTGIPVDISKGYQNLKVGDLMFFGKKAEGDKKERVRHVAFYIGNNEFIHASGCIRVSSLDSNKPNYDERNTKEFIRASRIIGTVDKEGSGIWSIGRNSFY